MTHPTLKAMVEAAEKATPGPWQQYDDGGTTASGVNYGAAYADGVWGPNGPGHGLVAECYDLVGGDRVANAKHIALANPTNILSLAEYVRGLEEKAAALELVREEAAKDNSPFGRSDSLALDRVRTVLGLPLGGKP